MRPGDLRREARRGGVGRRHAHGEVARAEGAAVVVDDVGDHEERRRVGDGERPSTAPAARQAAVVDRACAPAVDARNEWRAGRERRRGQAGLVELRAQEVAVAVVGLQVVRDRVTRVGVGRVAPVEGGGGVDYRRPVRRGGERRGARRLVVGHRRRYRADADGAPVRRRLDNPDLERRGGRFDDVRDVDRLRLGLAAFVEEFRRRGEVHPGVRVGRVDPHERLVGAANVCRARAVPDGHGDARDHRPDRDGGDVHGERLAIRIGAAFADRIISATVEVAGLVHVLNVAEPAYVVAVGHGLQRDGHGVGHGGSSRQRRRSDDGRRQDDSEPKPLQTPRDRVPTARGGSSEPRRERHAADGAASVFRIHLILLDLSGPSKPRARCLDFPCEHCRH